MKVIAVTRNGMNIQKEIEVTKITIGCKSHPVKEGVIKMLLNEVRQSGKMQIYNTDIEQLHGKLDAIDSTPLYTNGQESVIKLKVDDVVVWEK